jgi:sRNA-binding regulator protein Hfq
MQLSAQEIIDCDGNQFGCEGGYVNKVLNFGKKKGFIQQDCMEYNGKKEECGVEHFEVNECRVESQIWKVNDYCIAIQEENIKRELFKNGPVIAQMQPYTDFLAYKEGSYHRT